MNRRIILPIIAIITILDTKGQDPHFSQFFMAPHFVNPARVGTLYGDWSVMGNFRQQWANAGTAFHTQALAAEAKVMGLEDGSNVFAIGFSMMNDQSMKGAFRSNYASATAAYHLQLDDHNRFGAGFQGSYSKRTLDFTRLSFGEQFTGRGFDLAVPSGEPMIYNMPAFLSVATGLNYSYSTRNFNADIGLAVYDLNRPNQSFLNRINRLEPRYTFNMNMDYLTEGSVVLNASGFFHLQTIQSYFALGGSMGLAVSPGSWDKILYAGGWFREGDVFLPYVGMQVNDVRVGLTYDVTYSKQNKGPTNPQSVEISFLYTRSRQTRNAPPCPIPRRHMRDNIRLY